MCYTTENEIIQSRLAIIDIIENVIFVFSHMTLIPLIRILNEIRLPNFYTFQKPRQKSHSMPILQPSELVMYNMLQMHSIFLFSFHFCRFIFEGQ